MDPTRPTAEVRKLEESIPALILVAQAGFAAFATTERRNLERAVELGKTLLKIKAKCKHGEWIPTLAKVGISRQRAWEFIRFAKCPPVDISACDSIADARKLFSESGEEQEIDSSNEQADAFREPTGNGDEPDAEQEPTKHTGHGPRTPYCDVCKRAVRLGMTIAKSCNACKEAKKSLDDANPWKKQPRPEKESTGGFDLRSVGAHCRSVVRHILNLAKDYHKPVDTPEIAAVKQKAVDLALAVRELKNRLKEEAKRAAG